MKKQPIIFATMLLAISLMISQCVEPYDAESIDYEKIIVVDGTITNELKNHQIKINYTSPVDSFASIAVKNAEVWVITSDGSRIDFNEGENGVYESTSEFSGTTGATYTLNFTTEEGKSYYSDPETLVASPPIDSIYDRYAELVDEELNATVGGIQFFIDSHDDTEAAKYFRYEWEHTFQIRPDYPSRFYYDSFANDIVGRPYLTEDDITTCYKSDASTELIVGATTGSTENRMAEFPVNFVNDVEPTLRVRYSILVRQYAITDKAYNYYKKIKEASENAGSLFDQQQGSISGNVHAADDESELVLGYFEASGMDSLRAFFRFRDLDSRFDQPANFYPCISSDIVNVIGIDSIISLSDPTNPANNGIEYFIIDYNRYGPEGPEGTLAEKRCTTCDWFATTKRPSFWTEKYF